MGNLSEGVTSGVAVVVVIGVMVLIGLGIPVPTELWAAFGLVLGFFFGNQTGQARSLTKSK